MELTIKKGTQSQTIRFFLFEEQGTGGKTGVTAHSEGLDAVYLRDGDLSPTRIDLKPWRTDTHVPGGFREIDADTMPGLYELGLPDEVCSEGANRATLMLRASGASPNVVHLDLVAYDPYDGYRLGLECLTREGRHYVISTAFREVVPEIVAEFRGKPAPDNS
jgi:hypothetical protein